MDIRELTAGIASNPALIDAAGRAGVNPDQAQSMLQGVLEHATAGGDVAGMAEGIAAKVGVQPDQVQQFLPCVMGLLQSHSQTAPAGVQGGLSGLVSSLQSSPLGGVLSGADPGQGGSIADKAMGLVKGLFGSPPS